MSAKKNRAPLAYGRSKRLWVWTGLVFLFLYLPLLSVMLFSFNDSRRTIVWQGFTFRWYEKLAGNGELLQAFGNSLFIAIVCTVLSLILGSLSAFALWRFKFGLKSAFDSAMTVPMVVPEICMGVAMMVFFTRIVPWPVGLSWPFNLGAIIISHTTFAFPFVAMVVRARLNSFNMEFEEAARVLGAGPFDVIKDITIPHVRPALIAGGLLAFTLSLDDFVITFFTAGPDTLTFPVKVYSMLRFSVTPEVNAASTLLIVITALVTVLAMRFTGKTGVTAGKE